MYQRPQGRFLDWCELQGTRAKGRICQATCLQEGSIKQKNMYIYIINVCSERHDVQIASTQKVGQFATYRNDEFNAVGRTGAEVREIRTHGHTP